jgi:hypothetical protein
MFSVLQVVTVIFAAVAMALALAHALELPGKMRLNKDAYYAMQSTYYPGFTIGGVAEPVAIILTAILLFLTPLGTAGFWLTLVALLGLIGMEIVYWLFTHPVNKFWVQDVKLSSFGSGFFSFSTNRGGTHPADWTVLRDRWEYSHVARAGFALVSLTALVVSLLIV